MAPAQWMSCLLVFSATGGLQEQHSSASKQLIFPETTPQQLQQRHQVYLVRQQSLALSRGMLEPLQQRQ